jgi:hypothetical protein
MSETATADTIRKTEDLTHQGVKAVEIVTRATEQAAQSETALVGEVVTKNAQVIISRQHEVMENASQSGRRIIDASQGNVKTMFAFATVPYSAEGGLKELQRGVAGLVEGVMQTNLKLMREMLQPKSPGAYLELQQQFAREYLESLWQGTTMLVRATRRIADESLRPLEQRAEA